MDTWLWLFDIFSPWPTKIDSYLALLRFISLDLFAGLPPRFSASSSDESKKRTDVEDPKEKQKKRQKEETKPKKEKKEKSEKSEKAAKDTPKKASPKKSDDTDSDDKEKQPSKKRPAAGELLLFRAIHRPPVLQCHIVWNSLIGSLLFDFRWICCIIRQVLQRKDPPWLPPRAARKRKSKRQMKKLVPRSLFWQVYIWQICLCLNSELLDFSLIKKSGRGSQTFAGRDCSKDHPRVHWIKRRKRCQRWVFKRKWWGKWVFVKFKGGRGRCHTKIAKRKELGEKTWGGWSMPWDTFFSGLNVGTWPKPKKEGTSWQCWEARGKSKSERKGKSKCERKGKSKCERKDKSKCERNDKRKCRRKYKSTCERIGKSKSKNQSDQDGPEGTCKSTHDNGGFEEKASFCSGLSSHVFAMIARGFGSLASSLSSSSSSSSSSSQGISRSIWWPRLTAWGGKLQRRNVQRITWSGRMVATLLAWHCWTVCAVKVWRLLKCTKKKVSGHALKMDEFQDKIC